MSRNRALLVPGVFAVITALYIAFLQGWVVSDASAAILNSGALGSEWLGSLLAVFLESVSFGLPFAVAATFVALHRMKVTPALVAPSIGIVLPLAITSVWHALASGSWMPRLFEYAGLSNTSQLTADAAGAVIGISLVVLASIEPSGERSDSRRHRRGRHAGTAAAS